MPKRIRQDVVDKFSMAKTPTKDGELKHMGNSRKAAFCNSDCCSVCCLPFFSFGKTSYRLEQLQYGGNPLDLEGYSACNEGCFGCCIISFLPPYCWYAIPIALQSGEVRYQYDLKGSGSNDCCKSLCCPLCTLAQSDREIRLQEEAKRAGNNGLPHTKQPLPEEPMKYGGPDDDKPDDGKPDDVPSRVPGMPPSPNTPNPPDAGIPTDLAHPKGSPPRKGICKSCLESAVLRQKPNREEDSVELDIIYDKQPQRDAHGFEVVFGHPISDKCPVIEAKTFPMPEQPRPVKLSNTGMKRLWYEKSRNDIVIKNPINAVREKYLRFQSHDTSRTAESVRSKSPRVRQKWDITITRLSEGQTDTREKTSAYEHAASPPVSKEDFAEIQKQSITIHTHDNDAKEDKSSAQEKNSGTSTSKPGWLHMIHEDPQVPLPSSARPHRIADDPKVSTPTRQVPNKHHISADPKSPLPKVPAAHEMQSDKTYLSLRPSERHMISTDVVVPLPLETKFHTIKDDEMVPTPQPTTPHRIQDDPFVPIPTPIICDFEKSKSPQPPPVKLESLTEGEKAGATAALEKIFPKNSDKKDKKNKKPLKNDDPEPEKTPCHHSANTCLADNSVHAVAVKEQTLVTTTTTKATQGQMKSAIKAAQNVEEPPTNGRAQVSVTEERTASLLESRVMSTVNHDPVASQRTAQSANAVSQAAARFATLETFRGPSPLASAPAPTTTTAATSSSTSSQRITSFFARRVSTVPAVGSAPKLGGVTTQVPSKATSQSKAAAGPRGRWPARPRAASAATNAMPRPAAAAAAAAASGSRAFPLGGGGAICFGYKDYRINAGVDGPAGEEDDEVDDNDSFTPCCCQDDDLEPGAGPVELQETPGTGTARCCGCAPACGDDGEIDPVFDDDEDDDADSDGETGLCLAVGPTRDDAPVAAAGQDARGCGETGCPCSPAAFPAVTADSRIATAAGAATALTAASENVQDDTQPDPAPPASLQPTVPSTPAFASVSTPSLANPRVGGGMGVDGTMDEEGMATDFDVKMMATAAALALASSHVEEGTARTLKFRRAAAGAAVETRLAGRGRWHSERGGCWSAEL